MNTEQECRSGLLLDLNFSWSRSQGLLCYQEEDPEGTLSSAQDQRKIFKDALIFLYYCFL